MAQHMVIPYPCVECDGLPTLVTGKTIYPHRQDLHFRNFWLCQCGAYVGCHRGSEAPLGRPAGQATRRIRIQAHALFDPLWKSKGMDRSEAYRWIQDRMGLDRSEAHISMMDEARCVQLLCLLEENEEAT